MGGCSQIDRIPLFLGSVVPYLPSYRIPGYNAWHASFENVLSTGVFLKIKKVKLAGATPRFVSPHPPSWVFMWLLAREFSP